MTCVYALSCRRPRLCGGLIGVAWALVTGLASFAAEPPPGAGVADRARPDYDRVGAPLGLGRLYPELGLAMVAEDNVFAEDGDAVDDIYLLARPAIAFRTNAGRYKADLSAYAAHRAYREETSEDRTDWGAAGAFEINMDGRLAARFAAAIDAAREDRGAIDAPLEAVEPVPARRFGGDGAVIFILNRLRFSLGGRYAVADYDDVAARGGGVIDQDFRDNAAAFARVKAALNLAPRVSAFIAAEAGRTDYDDDASFDRDSDGVKAEVGLDIEATKLLYGALSVGAAREEFAAGTVESETFNAAVLWNATPLTSFRLSASRGVDAGVSTASVGRVATEVAAGVDHEVLRNLVLTLEGERGVYDYDAEARTDEIWGAAFRARYLLNPSVYATFETRHDQRRSDLPFRDYDRTVLSIGLNVGR
ncbi:MAG: outer membrane beta-barrel protein [Pseudomonadota bacterium]